MCNKNPFERHIRKDGNLNLHRARLDQDIASLFQELPWCKSINELRYCFENGIRSEPICIHCNTNSCTFRNKKYTTYCSYQCANKDLYSKKYEKIKKTTLEKYGVEHVFKNSKIQEKIKKTNLEKYGVKNPLSNKKVREKIKHTNILKYGSSAAPNSPKLKEKIKQANIKKYGVEHYTQTQEYRDRVKKRIEKNPTPEPTEEIQTISETLSTNKFFTYKELAEKANINYKRFIELIKKYSIDDPYKYYRNKKHLYDASQKDQLEQDYKHTTIEELAKKYNVSPACMQRVLVKHEIPAKFKYSQSSQEREIIDFLENNNIKNILINNRTAIEPYELDIYLPDYNLAIEYNGDYWHTTDTNKKCNRHKNKYRLCRSKNIRLLQIRGTDWKTKKSIWKSIILSNLNICEQKIYARKCDIRIVPHNEAKVFLDENHLQQSTTARLNIGLYYDNTLYMIQTFRASRFKKGVDELVRMCTRKNCLVIGGASKLFKHYLKNYKKRAVHTFADLEYSNGDIYTTLGFTLTHETESNYHYFDGSRYINRMNFQKKKFDIPKEITEKEFFLNLNYRIYWDAGQKAFIYE